MDYKKLAIEIMENVCETDEVSEDLDMDLFEAGLIDSLSVINILLEIENKLGIRLQITDLEKSDISTINNFETFLKKGVKTTNNDKKNN